MPEKGVDHAIEIARRAGLPLKIGAAVHPGDRAWFRQEVWPTVEALQSFVEYLAALALVKQSGGFNKRASTVNQIGQNFNSFSPYDRVRAGFAYRVKGHRAAFIRPTWDPWIAFADVASEIPLLSPAERSCAAFTQSATSLQPCGRTMSLTGEHAISGDLPGDFHRIEVIPASAPSVTVIMANFNGQNWIREAIQSVQRQSLADWELIIVDDASTDASVQIVRTAADSDPRIVLLTLSSNAGPSVARNRALTCARGRWITVLDSDDLFAEGRLESLLAKAESDGEWIAADDLLIMNERGSLTGHSLLGLQTSRTFDAVALVEAPHLGYLKPMIKAELLAEHRYDERVRAAEDFDLLLRVLVKHDARIIVYPAMGYHYRRRDGSLSADKSADRPSLQGMLEANTRFRALHGLSERLADACAHRHRSLETSLRWVDVTEAVRERRFAAALRYTMDHPPVLSCAVRFFKKRFYLLALANNRRAKTLLGL
ncbi:glycosyltransferase family 2 protein [Paraburkholderia hospita]|uniref:glycosyltransferase family 2 protein n=1 Tax=Paraburkholderia hospita TaxID=169430 RepID=UPI001F61D5BB|nr:glycosyltransferase family 2 protein [Paraburkholderia hospita]